MPPIARYIGATGSSVIATVWSRVVADSVSDDRSIEGSFIDNRLCFCGSNKGESTSKEEGKTQ
jgi:hypothetical protein